VGQRRTFIPFRDFLIDRVLLAALSRVEAGLTELDLMKGTLAEASDRIATDHCFVVPCLAFDDLSEEAARTKRPSPHFRGQAYDAPVLRFKVPYEGHPDFLRCYSRIRSGDTSCAFFLDDSSLCFEIARERTSPTQIDELRDRHLAILRNGMPPITAAAEAHNLKVLARIKARLDLLDPESAG
jgi:hypothetical protein